MTIADLKPGDKFRLPDNPHVFRLLRFRPYGSFYPNWIMADIETDWGTYPTWPIDREILPLQLSLF